MANYVVYEVFIGPKKQIGSTGRLARRMQEHLASLESGTHCNPKMQYTYNKYKSFSYSIVSKHETRSEAYIEEQRLLDLLYNSEHILNTNPKATAPPTKFGDDNSSRNPDVIRKIVETKRKNGSFSKSKQAREKISKANKGRKQSIEEKEVRAVTLAAVKQTAIYKSNHKRGCQEAFEKKSEQAKLNSTKLFRESNPSHREQICTVCGRLIKGASAYKRFHGTNCKAQNKI